MSSSGCHPGDFSPYNQQKGDRKGKSREKARASLTFLRTSGIKKVENKKEKEEADLQVCI